MLQNVILTSALPSTSTYLMNVEHQLISSYYSLKSRLPKGSMSSHSSENDTPVK